MIKNWLKRMGAAFVGLCSNRRNRRIVVVATIFKLMLGRSELTEEDRRALNEQFKLATDLDAMKMADLISALLFRHTDAAKALGQAKDVDSNREEIIDKLVDEISRPYRYDNRDVMRQDIQRVMTFSRIHH